MWIHTYMCTLMFRYVSTHAHTLITCRYVHTHVHAHSGTCSYMCTHIQVHVDVCIHTFWHMNIHMYTTYTWSPFLQWGITGMFKNHCCFSGTRKCLPQWHFHPSARRQSLWQAVFTPCFIGESSVWGVAECVHLHCCVCHSRKATMGSLWRALVWPSYCTALSMFHPRCPCALSPSPGNASCHSHCSPLLERPAAAATTTFLGPPFPLTRWCFPSPKYRVSSLCCKYPRLPSPWVSEQMSRRALPLNAAEPQYFRWCFSWHSDIAPHPGAS